MKEKLETQTPTKKKIKIILKSAIWKKKKVTVSIWGCYHYLGSHLFSACIQLCRSQAHMSPPPWAPPQPPLCSPCHQDSAPAFSISGRRNEGINKWTSEQKVGEKNSTQNLSPGRSQEGKRKLPRAAGTCGTPLPPLPGPLCSRQSRLRARE